MKTTDPIMPVSRWWLLAIMLSGIVFATIVVLLFAAVTSVDAMPTDSFVSPQEPTVSATMPELGGQWLFDEQAGNWWYLHSDEEFDSPVERCNECHGEGAFFSYTKLCPDPDTQCRLIVDGDELRWECVGKLEY